ncbi:MAG: hypothetical protein O3B84_00965, partial [Chloroflexi bacterium]|nr:hypothetical protein [Chloroflexota bacterium]
MAQPCVFVGMGGTGMSLVSNLYGRLSRSRSQKSLIGERYFFVLFDTEPRPSTLPDQIEYFQLYGKPDMDLPAVRKAIGGFDEWFPPAPYAPPASKFPGAGQETNFTFFAFCNFILNNPQALTTLSNKIANRLIKLNPNTDFAMKGAQAYLPTVYLGGCCGGTGAGLSLHLPYLLRFLLGVRMGEVNVTVVNFGLLNSPEATSLFKPLNDSMKANAYATAWTLDNWQMLVPGRETSPDWRYRMDYGFPIAEGKVANLDSNERPYDMVYWVGNRVDGGQELTAKQVSDATTDFLYGAFCGTNTSDRYKAHLSNVINSCSDPITDPETGAARAQSYGSFCVARLQFPRENILKYCGDFVAARWRHLFVDVHHDDLDADMASVVATIAGKHYLSESNIHRIWRDRSGDLSIELSRPKDKRRDMLKCASSHALGTHIASCMEELEESYQETIAQMKRDLRAETTADDLVAKLAEDLLSCLKG